MPQACDLRWWVSPRWGLGGVSSTIRIKGLIKSPKGALFVSTGRRPVRVKNKNTK